MVEGDYIQGNRLNGVAVYDGANKNTIGGTATGSGDVISGNASNGVFLSDAGTSGNLVEGDLIGTDASGANDVANSASGVYIGSGATKNTIGGTTVAARDVLSGNGWEGVNIVGGGTSDNVVEGDYIGVAFSGTAALGNAESGVGISGGACNNTIGGTAVGSGNLISGNFSNGVYISDTTTNSNVVEGDLIGTVASGETPCPTRPAGCTSATGPTTTPLAGPPSPPATSSLATVGRA